LEAPLPLHANELHVELNRLSGLGLLKELQLARTTTPLGALRKVWKSHPSKGALDSRLVEVDRMHAPQPDLGSGGTVLELRPGVTDQAEHFLGQKRLPRGRVARDEAVYSLCLEPPPPGPDDAASDAESAARRVKSSFSGELEDPKTLFDSEAVPGGNSRGLDHRLLLSASPGQFSTRHFTG